MKYFILAVMLLISGCTKEEYISDYCILYHPVLPDDNFKMLKPETVESLLINMYTYKRQCL